MVSTRYSIMLTFSSYSSFNALCNNTVEQRKDGPLILLGRAYMIKDECVGDVASVFWMDIEDVNKQMLGLVAFTAG